MKVAWIREDLHVHSTFSDGAGSVAENVRQASALGLRRLGCVDHVRRDTDWVPAYAEAVRRAARFASLEVLCGVEAKILDEEGLLDCPLDLAGVDRIYVADHRWPYGRECLTPEEVLRLLAAGKVSRSRLLDSLLRATANALKARPQIVLAHLFSILPKVGMDESEVPRSALEELARSAAEGDAILEVSERWRCPSPRTVQVFVDHGVPIEFSTDSHRVSEIGRYSYAEEVVLAVDWQLAATGGRP